MAFLTGAIQADTRFVDGDFRKLVPRFTPENLSHNMALVALVQQWAQRKNAAPAQIALAWLMAQRPWIVPIPGTTQMPHLIENLGAVAVQLTPSELAELNATASSIQIQGARLPEAVLALSELEAPPRK